MLFEIYGDRIIVGKPNFPWCFWCLWAHPSETRSIASIRLLLHSSTLFQILHSELAITFDTIYIYIYWVSCSVENLINKLFNGHLATNERSQPNLTSDFLQQCNQNYSSDTRDMDERIGRLKEGYRKFQYAFISFTLN